jgi:hypothetical protein
MALPVSSGNVTVTISGLPSDVSLSDSAGSLTITNGSITLTRSAGNAGLIRHRSGGADCEDVGMARHRQIDADLHPPCAIVFRIEPACRRRGHHAGSARGISGEEPLGDCLGWPPLTISAVHAPDRSILRP